MSSPIPIHLPGTTLEGGGQLVRLATCLASLTSKPIHITSIRGNRSGGGGLKAQHLTSIQWLAQASKARVSGMGLKSKEIKFRPSPPNTSPDGNGLGVMSPWEMTGGDITIKQSTPGSVNLILQAILPYILFGATSSEPVRIHITGGTNVSNSPSCDYVEQVLFPMLSLIGIPPMASKVHSRGWSQGSTTLGTVTYTVTPLSSPSPSPSPEYESDTKESHDAPPKLPAFTLTSRGTISSIHATIIAPATHQAAIHSHLLPTLTSASFQSALLSPPPSTTTDPPSPSPLTITPTISFEPSHHAKRFYLLLVATSSTGIKLGHDWLYDRAIRPDAPHDAIARELVDKVVRGLLAEVRHGGCVDEYMRDQLVVFQALAQGRSVVDGGRQRRRREDTDGEEREMVQPSLHARTAMWVAERILGVQFDGEGACEGVGWTSSSSSPFRSNKEEEQAGVDDITARIAQLGA